MDEYFVLNALFLVMMTYFVSKLYRMIEKLVNSLETEVQRTQYTLHNQPPIEFPEIKVPPPPPPIPDKWFERMEDYLSKEPEIDLSEIEKKINDMSYAQIKIDKLDKFFVWNDTTQEWRRR
jgi:hypothetical protein|tara:strand:- start:1246 stop:1608 length:363 start_codon:yes stop_codon:yes gene_type:complete